MEPPSPDAIRSITPRLSREDSDPSSGHVPDDHREFLEKLKRKTTGNISRAAPIVEEEPHIPVFARNVSRSNLTTITPVDLEEATPVSDSTTKSAAEENDKEEKKDEEVAQISTIDSSSRENKGDTLDPDDIRHSGTTRHQHEDDEFQRDDFPPKSDMRSFEHGDYDRYPPPPRNRDYYDRYRDPYYRGPYGGPPPAKRPFPDHYDRRPPRPYYRY